MSAQWRASIEQLEISFFAVIIFYGQVEVSTQNYVSSVTPKEGAMRRLVLSLSVLMIMAGCMVRQQDLDAWTGQPVQLLDTHPFFITVPMYKTIAADGTEVRNYRNGRTIESCTINPYNPYMLTASCFQNDVVCNNIFYIKNGKVLRYVPTGRCRTAEFLHPQKMY